MKKIVLFIFLLLGTTYLSVGLLYAGSANTAAATKRATMAAQAVSLDKIVAVINEDVITQSEYNRALLSAQTEIESQHQVMPDPKIFHQQVLNQLINKKLQLNLAKDAGIKVSDHDIAHTIQTIAKENQLSVNELYDHLHNMGISKAAYQVGLREQLTLQKLQQQAVDAHLTVTPQEVTDFIRSQTWHNDTSKEYHLEDVLIPLSETPSQQELTAADKEAQMVIDKFKQKQSYQAIVQAGATAKPALQGADLGWRKLPEIPTVFAARVVHMQLQQVDGPIQAPNGLHVIRLVALRVATTAENHGLPSRKQVENILLQRKFEEAVETWVSKLRSQAFVKIYT
jgi:peptidyl-prolyl cis-trans isomerase SurA